MSDVGGEANRVCPSISSALGTPLPTPGKELLVHSNLGGSQGITWRGQGLCHSFTHRVIPSCHLPGRTESQGWRTGAWVPGVRGGRWVSRREVVAGQGGSQALCPHRRALVGIYTCAEGTQTHTCAHTRIPSAKRLPKVQPGTGYTGGLCMYSLCNFLQIKSHFTIES